MPTLGSVVAVAVAVAVAAVARLPWSGRCSKRAAHVAMAMQGRPVVGTRWQVVVPPPPVPPPPSAVTVQYRVLGRLLASATGSSLTTTPVVRRMPALQRMATTLEQRRLKTTGNSLKPRRCCSSCKTSYVARCMRGSVPMYAHVQTCVSLPVSPSMCVSASVCLSVCLCVCVSASVSLRLCLCVCVPPYVSLCVYVCVCVKQGTKPSARGADAVRAATLALNASNHRIMALTFSLDAVAGHGPSLAGSPMSDAARRAVMPTPQHEVAFGIVAGHLRAAPGVAVLLSLPLDHEAQVCGCVAVAVGRALLCVCFGDTIFPYPSMTVLSGPPHGASRAARGIE